MCLVLGLRGSRIIVLASLHQRRILAGIGAFNVVSLACARAFEVHECIFFYPLFMQAPSADSKEVCIS